MNIGNFKDGLEANKQVNSRIKTKNKYTHTQN